MLRLFVAVAFCLLVTASAVPYLKAEHGIVVKVNPDQHFVGLFVEGQSSFRLTVSHESTEPLSRVETPMLARPTSYAAFAPTQSGNWYGIKTLFGEIRIDVSTGAFQMLNSAGTVITQVSKLSRYTPNSGEKAFLTSNDTCVNIYESTDCSSGTRTPDCPWGLTVKSTDECCAACNRDKSCTFWVYATPSHPDPSGKNCWLLYNVPKRVDRTGRISGGFTLPGQSSITMFLGRDNSALFYGAGGGGSTSLTFTQSQSRVGNTYYSAPYYWSSEGYGALGVSSFHYTPGDIPGYPAQWKSSNMGSENVIQWDIRGTRADIYLMPAKDPYAGMKTYWQLTGAPLIPPKYAFGFLACRWGWESREYIADILTKFRSGNYPIDAFILDFEWYTPRADYTLPLSGDPNYYDFIYNDKVFPAPVEQLKEYHEKYHVRFGGIRKPRLGNSGLLTMARSKNWCLPNARDLNYSMSDLAVYYQQQTQHFLPEGVDFWWNDEGETQYFTYHWWNEVQIKGLQDYDPKRRFFSLNRAFTPGLQRLGAQVWTGDVPVSWEALRQTAGYLLNWGWSGAGYVTCDVGGFVGGATPNNLLVRWYQVGVFLSLMRVHSGWQITPHFPFSYPEPYASYMRKSINLRYRLAPYIYSLAHDQYYNQRPMTRAMVFDYPKDSRVAKETNQWFMGDGLLVCPVMQEDNNREVYLPAATWFEFNKTTTKQGPTSFQLQNVPLDETPMYVRAGSILIFGPVVQYLDALPGGPLEVHVYGGADAQFTLYEDNGMTRDYEGTTAPTGAVRMTKFTYVDSTRTLTWSVIGSFVDQRIFNLLYARGFYQDGLRTTQMTVIGTSGRLVFT